MYETKISRVQGVQRADEAIEGWRKRKGRLVDW
jgi:hypothetical protein